MAWAGVTALLLKLEATIGCITPKREEVAAKEAVEGSGWAASERQRLGEDSSRVQRAQVDAVRFVYFLGCFRKAALRGRKLLCCTHKIPLRFLGGKV
ncbi:hypothetical protein NDU88_003037 [Pleurodeles waltl]|uniref:Secreted protein n=1 Tax=Pleurodeles waltl TaxID=8319 RepID=A0AAV7UCY4_PLEWA|nr:hypothetical protein NDU88_003037 [Pleurodeles waltl]